MFNLLCKWRQWKRLNGKRSFWSTSRPEQISAWSSHPNLTSAAPYHPLAAKTNMRGWVFHQIELIVMKNMPVKSLGFFIIGEKYLWDRWETAVTCAGCKLLHEWLAWYWSFLFQHFTIRGTFLDVWSGLRSLFLPVQKQLIVGVIWSGRNPLLVVKNKTKLKKKKFRGGGNPKEQ